MTRGDWANAVDFCANFEDEFINIDFNKAAVIKKIGQLTAQYSRKEKIGQRQAMKILFAKDLGRIKENILKIDFYDPEVELERYFSQFKFFIKESGIDYDRRLFIVDEFPKPYDFFNSNGTSGTNFDNADNKMFGLEQGIYLKREFLNPVNSAFILAHELIHNIAGAKDCDYLARGLEEGFTQFFGEIYLCSKVFGYQTALNHIINWRFGYPIREQRWEQYTDWLRQGCVFYQIFGIDGIIKMLKTGRGTIKKADRAMLSGKLNQMDLPRGGWTRELDECAQTIMSFNRNLVYSPLAVYLAQNLQTGQPIDELHAKLNIDDTAFDNAIKELNQRIFSVLVDENKIAIDDTKLYLDSQSLRYEISNHG